MNKAEMAPEREKALHIMAIDCCEHTIELLRTTVSDRLTAIVTQGKANLLKQNNDIDLIVIGIPNYPVRRPFISQLRESYAAVPMLILRRVDGKNGTAQMIHGEFVLSDRGYKNDLEIVSAIRAILPLTPCEHTPRELNYDTVREVMRIISENLANSALDLKKVARALPMSPAQLSQILNHKVGVSFRELLRQTRIEEAKRLLASGHYSVKEVAVRVGFSDSHYFSRTFKALTGHSASEYRSREALFGN